MPSMIKYNRGKLAGLSCLLPLKGLVSSAAVLPAAPAQNQRKKWLQKPWDGSWCFPPSPTLRAAGQMGRAAILRYFCCFPSINTNGQDPGGARQSKAEQGTSCTERLSAFPVKVSQMLGTPRDSVQISGSDLQEKVPPPIPPGATSRLQTVNVVCWERGWKKQQNPESHRRRWLSLPC